MYAADELYDTDALEESADAPRPCPTCDSTETEEITTEGPPEQSIWVCAECGSDEP